MPKLHQAKRKPIKDCPEWIRCCEGNIRMFLEDVQDNLIILDLLQISTQKGGVCCSCKSKRPEVICAIDTRDNAWTPLSCYDIDEAPYTEGQNAHFKTNPDSV